MASPRASSPISDGGSPEPLTPRTKIRALLATVQSSDEEDTTPTSNRLRRKDPKSPVSKPQFRAQPRPQPSQSNEGSDSDVEIRPRGRLASRMQGETTATPRIQQTSPKQQTPNEADNQPQNQDENDEDEDLPMVPRRLHRRVLRESTPEAREQSARSPSPGLFVSSPVRPSPSKSAASDDELPAPRSDKFKALLERKRQERLAREAEEKEKRAQRRAREGGLDSDMDLASDEDRVSNISDDEGGLRLTQMVRPTRKASKKAIEDMNRETQRMARSMQLAHEAKTRKKISKASLFERFNFRAPGMEPEPKTASSSRPGSPASDVDMKDSDTPPSSPPVDKATEVNNTNGASVAQDTRAVTVEPELDNPLEDLVNKVDKGKGKEVAVEEQPAPKKRQVRVRVPLKTTVPAAATSDDELEITTTAKDMMKAVFDSIPRTKVQERQSLIALRALAHARSPTKEGRQDTGMNPADFQAYLQQKARQQAKLERDRRLDALKAQGVVVQTAEERERQMQEVEDIVAKAREEAMKIMQQERAEAKKDGEHDPLAWDDSDDEEYQEVVDVSDVELSGSEEEDQENEADDEDDTPGNPMFDDEAEDSESESISGNEQLSQAGEAAGDMEELPTPKPRRARKNAAILSDDEDEVEATPRPKSLATMTPGAKNDSPAVPTSVLRSAKKTFIPGLPVQGPAGLGLTQIFAGTMDDSQMGSNPAPTQSMMPDFDNFPDSNFSATADEPVQTMILDSQPAETQGIQLNLSQSQMRGLDSLMREESYTQLSEMIEPSQDGGFQNHTPLKQRFVDAPVSTVETVMIDQEAEMQDSPLVRRGRLRRKNEMLADQSQLVVPGTETTESAFAILKAGADQERKRQRAEQFDRKKSKAKELVEEQAEESEDEYAGLGGADGEASDDESLASLEEIIDDAAGNDIDAAKLAAFYADRERANDEKEVEKLFKDITTGMLRRKRGADYDLSDSDDGGEARRRMKRRQFEKMRKALYSDERVKKMAENPGNQAFLRTIEDRNSDDEMDFLDVMEEPEVEESQSQEESGAQQQTIPDSQPGKPLGTAPENRTTNPRRSNGGRKPSNIGEVRRTLSNLLDEPHGSIIPATEAGSDSEDEGRPGSSRSDKENQGPNACRRPAAVVDRISLKRNSSSSLSNGNTRMAFAAASSSSTFKVPALLRRATTNSLMSGSSVSSSTSTAGKGSNSGFGEEGRIKKTAGKRSGVNAFARENERRAKINENERRREERKIKGAEKRLGVVGGLLGKGSFGA
ncbi:MRC1-like domain-containing protein [Stachybotrys elegans]|uniref:MRC1-like domain-containing protein n=1 Tax=Stachybotrys elegans TaxID=80388 RepID=A0A8K0SY49_9HYPO|nr:MRC1-like domain-containing protein [Stachybotrys elegans]